jgi:hypothetical protein
MDSAERMLQEPDISHKVHMFPVVNVCYSIFMAYRHPKYVIYVCS